MTSDGEDSRCDRMSKILDLEPVPMGAVSPAGELIVRIEASLGVNANACDGSYLLGRVKLTTCTGKLQCETVCYRRKACDSILMSFRECAERE